MGDVLGEMTPAHSKHTANYRENHTHVHVSTHMHTRGTPAFDHHRSARGTPLDRPPTQQCVINAHPLVLGGRRISPPPHPLPQDQAACSTAPRSTPTGARHRPLLRQGLLGVHSLAGGHYRLNRSLCRWQGWLWFFLPLMWGNQGAPPVSPVLLLLPVPLLSPSTQPRHGHHSSLGASRWGQVRPRLKASCFTGRGC